MTTRQLDRYTSVIGTLQKRNKSAHFGISWKAPKLLNCSKQAEGGRIACKATIYRLGLACQTLTTSFSLGKTSSEVYTCRLGLCSFNDKSRFKFRRSDGWNRVYRRIGQRYNDVCERKGQFGGGSITILAGIS